ncbi:MAG: filamentous hemagglutinin N-terminal domain-containing protein [Cyanophyceae cyanobacterium]
MKPLYRLLLLTGNIFLGMVISRSVSAQVAADGSLPTQVRSSGQDIEITGGAQVGDNLFHSFEEFSVPTNHTAFFNNAASIDNIISRVTGGQVSTIDGLIRANGGANLFLLNPSGILFGPNARLDIGGSFLASTAASLRFADGTEFIAAAGQTPGLTVSVPVGLQMSDTGGAIQVQGPGPSLTVAQPPSPILRGTSGGLQVQPGQTLALVGGRVSSEAGILAAPGGRVELGSVAAGTVGLQPAATGWTLDYQEVQSFQDIQLTRSLLDASDTGRVGGSIQLQGRQLELQNGSLALIQNLGNQPAGTLSAIASESIVLTGTNADGTIRSGLINEALGSGDGGNIFVTTEQLSVRDGATIAAQTFGPAASGSLQIDAASVDLSGTNRINPGITSSITATTLAANGGEAGDLTINTERLTLGNGALISTATLGSATGGDITIRASESVELTGTGFEEFQGLILTGLDGTVELADLRSGILTGTRAGQAGNLTIITPQLSLREGAIVTTATLGAGSGGDLFVNASEQVELTSSGLVSTALGSGNAGDVSIETGTLTVRDGAVISTSTLGSGAGGKLTVEALSVELLRTPAGAVIPTGLFTNSLDAQNEGIAGDLTITTQQLSVREGARVASQSGGQVNRPGAPPIISAGGNGGELTVNASDSVEVAGISPDGQFTSVLSTATFSDAPAGDLELTTGRLVVENQAEVAVNSLGSGAAGELLVEADSVLVNNEAAINATTFSGRGGTITILADDVRWRRNSETTVRALGTGSGGNVFIEADTVIALEDSDINASAVEGDGGNIQITAQGIFLCAECEVIASSELGVDGVVEINVPETETQLEFLELPQEVIRPEQVIALSCAANGDETASQFTITGRGGLPPRPSDPLSPQALVTFEAEAAADSPEPAIAADGDAASLPPPAQGWYRNEQGVVVLAAEGTARRSSLTPPDCHTP